MTNTTFKTFLESSVISLSISELDNIDDLLNIIIKNCKNSLWMIKNRTYLFRGDASIVDSISSGFAIINPTVSLRKSENTTNWYTLIIDNSPFYKDFPKRSKSLVCTNNETMASDYGNEDIIVLIPFDNCKIGCVNKSDIWEVTVPFPGTYKSLEEANDIFDELYDQGVIDESWDGILAFSKKIKTDKKYQEALEKAFRLYGVSTENLEAWKSDFLRQLLLAYSPLRTKMTVATTSTFKKEIATHSNEYWVGNGKVVCFNIKMMKYVQDKFKKYAND